MINPMSSDGTQTPQQQRDTTSVQITTLISAVVVVLAVVGAAVALSLAGRELAVIVGLITPVGAAAALLVAAIGKLSRLDKKQDEQSAKLDQVAHQTNGAMRALIREEIRAARGDQQP